jgi:4-hydroxybenzoate polyprenyltransferase
MVLTWLRLFRPRDQLKNAIVLLPVVFVVPALTGDDLPGVLESTRGTGALLAAALAACVAFCLVAAGSYAMNDAVDAPRDRDHPVKRRRPVAAGLVSSGAALRAGIALMAIGTGLAFAIDVGVGAIVSIHVALQVAYTLRLERVPHVDAMVLATGFGLRAGAGAAAIDVPLSMWMLLCVFFLGLYLGFVKRLCDLSIAEADGGAAAGWEPHGGYRDRAELNWLLGLTGSLTVLTYLMYALSEHASAVFGVRSRGFALLSPLVLIAIHRLYRRSSRGRSDSPVAAVFEDRTVRACVVLFTIGVVLTLYVPAVEQVLGHLFVAGAAGGGE